MSHLCWDLHRQREEDFHLEKELQKLRKEKEDADMNLGTSNSQVNDLKVRVSDLELASTQAQSTIEFLRWELNEMKEGKVEAVSSRHVLEGQLSVLTFRNQHLEQEFNFFSSATGLGQRNCSQRLQEV